MMDEYFAVPISPSNKRAMAQMDALLAREGVTLRDEQHVDLRRHRWQCE